MIPRENLPGQVPNKPGIYFLYKRTNCGTRLVYIGYATRLRNRLSNHGRNYLFWKWWRRGGHPGVFNTGCIKPFDYFRYSIIKTNNIEEIERRYINETKPIFNDMTFDAWGQGKGYEQMVNEA